MNNNDTQIIEWDVATWSRAVRCWETAIQEHRWNLSQGLELGGRNGGISLFFTRNIGTKIICSDKGAPSEKAKALHLEYAVSERIQYADIDATAIPYPDDTFDFVVFKSMLGVVGAHGRVANIDQAIGEIHRVLKPGAVLFFAENLRGSMLHQLARRWFIPWGKNWLYLSLAEMEEFLSGFSMIKIETTGFLAAFVPKPIWLNQSIARLDTLFSPFSPKNWRYVCYGYAVKERCQNKGTIELNNGLLLTSHCNH